MTNVRVIGLDIHAATIDFSRPPGLSVEALGGVGARILRPEGSRDGHLLDLP